MKPELYPLIFQPIYKDHMWGGTRIADLYGRDLPGASCAESWEVADRPEGRSTVQNGPLAGRQLNELITQYGPALVGAAATPGPFPLLFKIIDARQRLSLQVHPHNENAQLVGGEPKTEAWYFLKSAPDAQVMVGLAAGVTPESFAKAELEGRLLSVVNTVPVAAGEVVFVPGGRIHAIDAGCLLLEVQQNSDTTFRVSDWGRLDREGCPRDLHQDEAMTVIEWDDTSTGKLDPRLIHEQPKITGWQLCTSPYFNVEKWRLLDSFQAANDGKSFHLLFLESGHLELKTGGSAQALKPGTTVLIPAAIGSYELEPCGPNPASNVVRITL